MKKAALFTGVALTVALCLAAPVPAPNFVRAAPSAAAGEHCVGWAVGGPDSGYGAIFRSTDGGATWTRQGSPATIPDVMLEAVAALAGFIAGQVLYATVLARA